jgi:hypothetical protein
MINIVEKLTEFLLDPLDTPALRMAGNHPREDDLDDEFDA